jgi:hypothetical protein
MLLTPLFSCQVPAAAGASAEVRALPLLPPRVCVDAARVAISIRPRHTVLLGVEGTCGNRRETRDERRETRDEGIGNRKDTCVCWYIDGEVLYVLVVYTDLLSCVPLFVILSLMCTFSSLPFLVLMLLYICSCTYALSRVKG